VSSWLLTGPSDAGDFASLSGAAGAWGALCAALGCSDTAGGFENSGDAGGLESSGDAGGFESSGDAGDFESSGAAGGFERSAAAWVFERSAGRAAVAGSCRKLSAARGVGGRSRDGGFSGGAEIEGSYAGTFAACG